jgi:hypothetical protein
LRGGYKWNEKRNENVGWYVTSSNSFHRWNRHKEKEKKKKERQMGKEKEKGEFGGEKKELTEFEEREEGKEEEEESEKKKKKKKKRKKRTHYVELESTFSGQTEEDEIV